MTTKLALVLSFTASAALIAGAAMAADSSRKLEATLTGANQVPGPGDTDGAGKASVTVNSGKNQICYDLSVSNIDTATAAHIHLGAAGVSGAVVVPLNAPADGDSKGCVTVEHSVAMAILKNPTGYYVNVHNATFPAGAIRGQLTK